MNLSYRVSHKKSLVFLLAIFFHCYHRFAIDATSVRIKDNETNVFINNVLLTIYFDKYVPFHNFYFIGMSNLKSSIYFCISSVYLFYITVHFVSVQIFKGN